MIGYLNKKDLPNKAGLFFAFVNDPARQFSKNPKDITFQIHLRSIPVSILIYQGVVTLKWLNDWLIEKRPAKRGRSFLFHSIKRYAGKK
jgi:hypothetical protein